MRPGRGTTAVDVVRRRAMGLAAWSAGVAVVGAATARSRARAALGAGGSASPAADGALPAPATGIAPAANATAGPASAGPATATAAATPGLQPAGASDTTALLDGDELVLHVARRVSFGPTPELLEEIRASGVDAWLDQQLAPFSIDDTEADRHLLALSDLRRDATEFRQMRGFVENSLADLRVAVVLRAVHSRRHLQEVMVDLWHDHLVASAVKIPVHWHLADYDRNAIRPHALGRYVDLLKAATRSGAMLEYLDTASSSAPDVNENHGRELLELHTVGRSAGYGQDDVVGAARVLSGWTVDARSLTVVFDPSRHHAGPASVLGWSTPGRSGPGAAADLDSLLEHLAFHPATATRIATLLVRRFVADDPPADVVESTATAYLDAGSDLAATLRHLFATPAFRSRTSIVRRPLDLFAAQLRATSAHMDVPNLVERLVPLVSGMDAPLGPLVDGLVLADPFAERLVEPSVGQRPIALSVADVLRRNGQPLFEAPRPSGHPVVGSRWSSGDALLRRWTFGAVLAHDGLYAITIDLNHLSGGALVAGDAVDALARRCFNTAASPTTRAGTLAAMDRTETDPIEHPFQLRLALSFLLAAPEMQTR